MGRQQRPALLWNGKNHVAVWFDYQESSGYHELVAPRIMAARIDDSGMILDRPAVALGEGELFNTPQIASCGGKPTVVWIKNLPDPSAANRARRRTERLVLLRLEPRAEHRNEARHGDDRRGGLWGGRPRLAWNGSSHLLYWQADDEDLEYVVRLDASGNPLSAPAPLPVGFEDKISPEPNLASNGSAWMLASRDGLNAHFLPIDATGQPAAQATTVPAPSGLVDAML